MEVYPLRSGIVKQGDSIARKIEKSISDSRFVPKDNDVVAVASKVVSVAEGRTRCLSRVKPTVQAVRLGKKFSLPASFVQVVLDEADVVYGGVKGAILTLKDGDAAANAGVDQKNAPEGTVVLWPADAGRSASRVREVLTRKFRRRMGVVIVDSRVTPLRLGTIGLALATSGFSPVRDFRGRPDLYGRTARITVQAVADGIAAAAHLLMGEATEMTPFVLVRGAPGQFDGTETRLSPNLSVRECLYMSLIST